MNDIEKAIETLIAEKKRQYDILDGLPPKSRDRAIDIVNMIKACELAISALEAQQADAWIPVSPGNMPDDRTEVDVTIREKANEVGGYRYYTSTAWMQDGTWVFKQNQYEPVIIAWKHRTGPWNEEQQ